MILFFALLNPINLILAINFIVFLSYEIYSVDFFLTLFPMIGLSVIFTFYIYRFLKIYSRSEIKKSITLDGNAWQIFGYIVIVTGLLELLYFGVPLLGHLRYVDFGLPILHHIAVTSWILVFVNFKYVWIQRLKLPYALLFPLFIFNRDIFLLTLVCVILKLLIHKRIKWRHLLFISTLFVTLFSYAGKLRSGNVQSIIDLPTKLDLEALNLITFWVFTYVTSPMFNIHYSYGTGQRILYEPLLTVFPEFYKLIQLLSFPGVYLYLLIGTFVTLIPALMKFPGWLCFSFFFYYQFTMGCIFSNKLGNTHTIYVILICTTMITFRQMYPKRLHK